MQICEFCQIVDKKSSARVVYETTGVLAFFPLYPATRGHTLVIPKIHIRDFLESDPQISMEVSLAVTTVGRALRDVFTPNGMNVITSAGETASQSVMHLHFHVVPRWSGDALGEIWPPQNPTAESLMEERADAVRQYFHAEQLKQRNHDQE
jgi:histidine triad (HIT) family protein